MRPSASRMMLFVAAVLIFSGNAGTQTPTVSFGKNVAISGRDQNNQPQFMNSIVVNPANASNLVSTFAGRFDTTSGDGCFFASSFNGGKNWTIGGPLVQASNHVCGDPSIGVDSAGNLYYSSLDIDFTTFAFSLQVAKSSDGGLTFSTPQLTVVQDPADSRSPSPDKPYIAADASPGSPFRDSIYQGFADFTTRGIAIKVVLSRDGGATWSAPITVVAPRNNENPALYRFSALPVVGPDGTVYMFWSEFPQVRVMGALSIRFSKSTDGGLTWSNSASVASGLPSPGFTNIKATDPLFGTAPFHGAAANTYPAAAVGANGNLYVAWMDFPQGSCTFYGSSDTPDCVGADVRLSVSSDGGTTWSAPAKVSDDSGTADQFLQWVAVQSDGRAGVLFMDRRGDPANISYRAFYTNTADGTSFLPNVRVSTMDSTPTGDEVLSLYSGLAASGQNVYPVWPDLRSGNVDVFFAVGTLP